MTYTWDNQLGSRGRRPWLLLVDREGRIHLFSGENIPGVVAVRGYDYRQAGKWSHTVYRLELACGVRAIAGLDGFETGRFVEGLRKAVRWPEPIDRWVDVANALGVTLAEAQRFLREWRPKAAAALDAVEEALGDIAERTGGDFDTVAVNFGGPTNRLIREGFWEWPVVVTDPAGHEVGRITCHPERGWSAPDVRGNVRVLAVERLAGYHGGYVSMRLAVPAGCDVRRLRGASAADGAVDAAVAASRGAPRAVKA